MTERDLQLAIVQHWRSSLVCAAPNYTPAGWWECDVWGVLKSGNWVEWECKVSRADLKADARKDKKHAKLASREHGPSRFYFVVPEELGIEEAEVPEWAGLAAVREYRSHPGLWVVRIVKQAPARGKFKVRKREIRMAQMRMWYRYWRCLVAMNKRGVAEPVEEQQEPA